MESVATKQGFQACIHDDLALLPHSVIPSELALCGVPAWLYQIQLQGQMVGWIDLRLSRSEELDRLAGQMGYAIFPPFRGQGLAARACFLLAPVATASGLWPLWLTTNTDNHASMSVLAKLGACAVEDVRVPVKHELYGRGDRVKRRFLWAP